MSNSARLRRATLLLALVVMAGGCAASSRSVRVEDASPARGWSRVSGVPELRQSSSQSCGAAALAMVLGRWQEPVTEREIWAAHTPPAGQGIRADALRDFARQRGLDAFLIEGQLSDLEREVGRDRPVIVGVMQRRGDRAYAHYEVVVGVNPRRELILVLDPARGAREVELRTFDAEWSAAGRLTLVVIPRAPPPVATAPAGAQ